MKLDLQMEYIPADSAVSMSRSAWQKSQFYFDLLNHIIIFIVAIYMSILCYGTGNRAISWHAWLCTIGYQLLMAEAISVFYSENVWSQQHTRSVRKTLHWILQTVGSLVAILGMIIEFLNKQQHFTTTHAILGLIAGLFTLIGMLNGVTALFSVELKKYVKPIYFKMAHNVTGIATFVLGMTALHFGYDRKYMIKNSRADIRIWLQMFAIITIVLSIVGALRSLLKQLRMVFK